MLVASTSVARVRPRTSKGITDLFWPNVSTGLSSVISLNEKFGLLSPEQKHPESCPVPPKPRHTPRITKSVGATGGVYKGQGRRQCELMTRAY